MITRKLKSFRLNCLLLLLFIILGNIENKFILNLSAQNLYYYNLY